jgi:peptidoglycan glycosyltransferase
MRRAFLLAGGLGLAAAGMLFAGSGSAQPPGEIRGEPLIARQDSDAPKAPPVPVSVDVQLDKITKVGDHYEAPLDDGRMAILTLDPDLQATAEKLLSQARAPRGAIVAMAPDGRILALAGRRTESPKGGTKGIADWRLATDVWAPAASIFKLVTASALVSSGVDPDDKVCYHGGLRSVTKANLEDSKSDSSCESLSYGVAKSNNAIVGKFAYQKLEAGALDKFAHQLGLDGTVQGATLGVHATCGELSLPKTKDLEFAQAAAGFSGSRLSVLGGALLAATFADGGTQPEPRLVAQIVGGADVSVTPPRRVLPEKVAKSVGRMMVATCDMGSAVKSFGRGRSIKVAGKTGTLATSQPFYMEHSWFVGYAPADKPEIIVSVLLGNSDNWHLRGHEAAKKLIDRAVRHAEDHDDDEAKPAKRLAKRR